MDKKTYYGEDDGMIWEDAPDENAYIWRYTKNPLFDMKKSEHFWHICNSATVMINGQYVGVFRCENKQGTPDLYVGKSKNGADWVLETTPIVFYNEDGTVFEKPYCYDPRLIKIDGAYYVVYCADIHGPSIYIAKTTDFKRFEMIPTGFLPFNRNGVLFPEKINGQYVMLNRPSDSGNTPFGNIYISYSNDMVYWGRHKLLMQNFHNDCYWERIKIGAGPTPMKTEEGWLLLYHGVQATCNGYTYSVGVALLDLEDPSIVKYRANRYLFAPEEVYEITGFTPNCIFPCSALTDSNGRIAIYYGAADTTMGIAFTTVEKLLEFVKKYNG